MPAAKTGERPDRTDWAALRDLPEDQIERAAVDDPDNPISDEEHWAEAIVESPRKTVVNAKFDADVVAWFKGQGRGYQGRMNAVLRMYMDAQGKKAG